MDTDQCTLYYLIVYCCTTNGVALELEAVLLREYLTPNWAVPDKRLFLSR